MTTSAIRVRPALGRIRWAAAIAVFVVAAIVPLILSDLTFFVQTTLAAVVVTGLSLFMGYAGQASLGQSAFVAVGGLSVAALTVNLGLPPLLTLVLAPVLDEPQRDGGLLLLQGVGQGCVLPGSSNLQRGRVGQHALLHRRQVPKQDLVEDGVAVGHGAVAQHCSAVVGLCYVIGD